MSIFCALAMKTDLNAAPNGSIVVLHLCSHNPTGADLNKSQWTELGDIVQSKKLVCVFDCAYPGYATGSLENDLFGLRYFVSRGIECLAAQSYAKNFGFYSERVGTVSVHCKTAQEAKAVSSQLRDFAEAQYGSPLLHGARVIAHVLGTPALRKEWLEELEIMAERIRAMRSALFNELQRLGTPGDWSHITRQIGMFSYTGLSEHQCEEMIRRFHVYGFPKDGRISIPGMTSSNVGIVAKAIHDVVTRP